MVKGRSRRFPAKIWRGVFPRQRFPVATVLVRPGPGAGLRQAFQVERAKFDHVLLDHASACGCEVRQGCAAKEIAREGDGWRVMLADGAVHGRWLIDASGRDTFLGRALGLQRTLLTSRSVLRCTRISTVYFAIPAMRKGISRSCG